MIASCTRTLLLPLLAAILFATGCVANRSGSDGSSLASISIVDQNGLSETISNRERLKQYQGVNFLANQPYQKVMRVHARNANGDVMAVITSYHPNGQVKQYLEVVNGRAYGTYREWLANGQIKVDATVIGGEGDIGTAAERSWLFDGCCTAREADGSLAAEIMYRKGALEGDSLHYHKNGSVWKRIPFTNNVAQGKAEYFLDDGTLLQTISYDKGEKHGEAVRYWGDKAVAAKESYYQGSLDDGVYYDRRGNSVAKVESGEGTRAVFNKEGVAEFQEYHQGAPEGMVKVYADNGALTSTYHVKEGKKHGEEIEYYESRLPQKQSTRKLSISWVDDSIQGICKTWYPNGVQESQREMSKNVKNGLCTAWYDDGGVMLIEQYETDILVKGKYFKKGDKNSISEVRDGKGTATLFDGKGNFLRKVEYQNGRPFS